MTRKEKLMGLMVRKEKAKLGQESIELGRLNQSAATARAQAEQLRSLLAESSSHHAGVTSKAALTSTLWFGSAIATQLTATEAQQEEQTALLDEARKRVATAEQRVRVYSEKADDTRRDARRAAEEKEDSRLGERATRPR